MNELTKPFGQWVANNIPLTIGVCLFFFCLLFEISKVKIYPLKWLWKLITWPFRKINEKRTNSIQNLFADLKADIDNQLKQLSSGTTQNCTVLKERFDSMEKRFDKLDTQQRDTEERLDKLAAARIKNHVLNFARQCRKGEPHSHEDFANLFNENKEYEILVEKYNWENDVYAEDYGYVKRVYRKMCDEGTLSGAGDQNGH